MNKEQNNEKSERRLVFLEGRIQRLEHLKVEVQALKGKVDRIEATLRGYYLTDYLADDK
ncbi:MAG: hypothetical protein F6K35_04565 [Okeania sp. SIO2H7]|nr:hypothetical protein [Okeania sp. SIO2H7]